jgi:methyltransferase (TIGR00027 family)
MLEGVGVTALIVAQARAAESVRADRLFVDPYAADFVARAGPDFASAAAELAPVLALRGNGSYIALRTRCFDDWLTEATAAGCRQVVLLGAGLDTRAYRLSWPADLSLYELDRPEVLAFKQGVLADRSAEPTCRRIVVPGDLREDWPSALAAAGFLAHQPTAWLLEGILMYLVESERDRLLVRVGSLSTPTSRLALDQRGPGSPRSPAARPDSIALGPADLAEQARQAGETVVARLGVQTPVDHADPSMADPADWLARHGWLARVYSAADRFAFYSRPVPPALESGAARIWLASAERSGEVA